MASTEAEVEVLCGQLASAVHAMMDIRAPSSLRMEAFSRTESFKEQSNPFLVIQCALLLSKPNSSLDTIVRHFGLKLLEDVIKLKWNEMNPEQKLFVKENAMRLMDEGVEDLLSSPNHLKDVIARIVVEIAKREWPQQWPSFLTELEALCSEGDKQTELVMFVMLRLVEDVALLQTLEQSQRRKEIYQALTAHMETIFQFLLTLLERHYQAYLTNTMATMKARHSKVCKSVLATFCAFVEWVPMNNIMANDRYLVKCLCHLLRDEQLQLHAAECLLGIVGWKAGKVSDRAQLLVLFNTDMISPLFEAVEAANLKTIQGNDDQHYLLLKRMVQILVELGGQLCSIWSSKDNGKEVTRPPDNFDIYLNALLAFTRHDSHMVSLYANELWAKFCRHPDISKDKAFMAFVPKWVGCALKKAVKVGHPSKDEHPSSAYARMDFETDEEFVSFFGRYRIVLAEVVKLVSATSPVIPYQFTHEWLLSILASGVNPTLYLELDAIQWLLDAILSKLTGQDELTPVLGPAMDLLKQCLDYKASDPLLKSVLLSCISSLFVVVTVTPAALMPVLNTVFACITYGGDLSQPMPDDVKALRRHGCALLVKMGSRYPATLVPVFDHLRSTIVSELYRRKALHNMEYVTLVEALVLVSNEQCNYQAQASFINSLAEPVIAQLRLLEAPISNAQAFMHHVGLDGSPVDANNRGELAFCIHFLLAVCRRAQVPGDPAKCHSGGFVDSAAGIKSPAGDVGCAVLRHVLLYAKTLNELFRPENRLKLAPGYAKAFEMLEVEKSNVMGTGHVARDSSDVDSDDEARKQQPNPKQQANQAHVQTVQKMQMFVFEQFENVYHLLTQCCSSLGHQFYGQPGLPNALVTHILQTLGPVPDYRLRAIVRTFLKALINKCPQAYFSPVLAPVLQQLCPVMLARLTETWKQLIAAREQPSFDEDNTDSQEVMDDVIGRQLTREYLDVIKAVLTSGGGGLDAGSSENISRSSSNSLALSSLGTLVMGHDTLGQCVVLTLLRALVWPDSQASARACGLLEIILPTLADQMSSSDAAHVMFTVLQALHTLGQHETNSIVLTQLATQAYEKLRPRHACVRDVLAQVPGCNADDLKRFDERVMQQQQQTESSNPRVLKNMFKKLVGQFVGKDVAQMFRKEVVIKNLPTLQLLKPRQKTPSLDEVDKNELGLATLFNGVEKKAAANNTTTPFML